MSRLKWLFAVLFCALVPTSAYAVCDPGVSSTTTGARLGYVWPDTNQCDWHTPMATFAASFDANVCAEGSDCEAAIEDKGGQVFHVMAYSLGDDCDGSDDMTVEIQAAENAADDNGGIVFIPGGTCIVSSSIVLSSNVTLLGAGPSSIIKAAANFGNNPIIRNEEWAAATDGARDTNITVANLQIDGNKSNNSTGSEFSHCFDFRTVIDLMVHGVTCLNPKGDGIIVQPGSTDTVFPLRNTLRGNHIIAPERQGIAVVAGDQVVISNNIIDNGVNHGIDLEPDSANNTIEGIAITGNSIADCGGGGSDAGINIDGHTGTVRSVTISSNTIEDQNGPGILYRGGTAIAIVGNTIRSPSSSGINRNGALGTTTGITVESNVIIDAGASAIIASNDKMTIVGNHVSGTTGDGGIVLSGASGCVVAGNTVYNTTGRGVLIQSSSDGNTISGNHIQTSTLSGINLESVDYNVVVGNFVDDGNNGILEAGTSNSNVIVGNFIDNSVVANLTITGAATITHSNIGGGNTAADYIDVDGDGTYEVGISGTTAEFDPDDDGTAEASIDGSGNLSLDGTATIKNDVFIDDDTDNSPTLLLRDADEKVLSLIKYDGGEAQIYNDEGEIRVLASGDMDDYFAVSTVSNVPRIRGVGSHMGFGDGTTTSHALAGEDDVLISGKLEVDGVAYFDGGMTGDVTGDCSGGCSCIDSDGDSTCEVSINASKVEFDPDDDGANPMTLDVTAAVAGSIHVASFDMPTSTSAVYAFGNSGAGSSRVTSDNLTVATAATFSNYKPAAGCGVDPYTGATIDEPVLGTNASTGAVICLDRMFKIMTDEIYPGSSTYVNLRVTGKEDDDDYATGPGFGTGTYTHSTLGTVVGVYIDSTSGMQCVGGVDDGDPCTPGSCTGPGECTGRICADDSSFCLVDSDCTTGACESTTQLNSTKSLHLWPGYGGYEQVFYSPIVDSQFLFTGSGASVVAVGDPTGSEPVEGVGFCMEGGTGDVCMKYDATGNDAEFTGATGGYTFDEDLTADGSITGTPPSAQTIAAGNTIAADACGGFKAITSAGDVTTDTTNTFTAPAAANAGCILHVCNTGANTITLDENANFISGGDVAVGPDDCLIVASDGSNWYQVSALEAN